ncbi:MULTISPECIES: type II toxin-antitoxin system Rv0910 family toxin [unclassified Gordonia (in: high G+C Gram-positive bacteria)]|uniref:type II toxin-antitoxin system Rv0910 family toxin n=1 Tax=unclassified Gordonia (in: high G+C Gram-positive bacteria) TaxID=2657482 RepID=UPI001FFE50BA|nr:SRPBCC family protein [Gordonia sp. PP30]UQE75790.1 SRPBCC family protein [Gordonia sp. PP30]
MAKTSDSIHVDLSPEDTFAAASDLSRFDDWLVLHDGWRGDVPSPDDLAVGTRATSVVKAKGTRVRFDWKVDTYDPPRRVRFSGNGKGGVKAKIDLTVEPDGDGSTVTFLIDLGGLPLMGPVGKAAAKAVHGDVHASLTRFRRVFVD